MTRAVTYGLLAGERALGARALADAEARFRQVLEVLDDLELEESPERVAALCGLGESERDQGKPEFRTTLLQASHLGVALGEVQLFIRAVLANQRGFTSVIGRVDPERIAYVEQALQIVGPVASPARAKLLALLASEVIFAGDHDRRVALARDAEVTARSLEDPELLAWVLARTGFAVVTLETIEDQVGRAREGVELADTTGDPVLRAISRAWYSAALLATGDLPGARRVLEDMQTVADDAAPTIQWDALCFSVRDLHLLGRLDEAHRVNDECFELGRSLGEPDALMWWGATIAGERYTRGESGATPEESAAFADEYPGAPTWRLSQVVALAYEGRLDEARRLMESHGLSPERLVREPFPLMVPLQFADVALRLGDADLARRCTQLLAGHEGCWGHYYLGVLGPVDLGLGWCALTVGNFDEALEHMEAACAAIEAAGARGLHPHGLLARAQAHLARNGSGDAVKAAALLAEARIEAVELSETRMVQRIDELAATTT